MHCEELGTLSVRERGHRAPKPTGHQAQHASATAEAEET